MCKEHIDNEFLTFNFWTRLNGMCKIYSCVLFHLEEEGQAKDFGTKIVVVYQAILIFLCSIQRNKGFLHVIDFCFTTIRFLKTLRFAPPPPLMSLLRRRVGKVSHGKAIKSAGKTLSLNKNNF